MYCRVKNLKSENHSGVIKNIVVTQQNSICQWIVLSKVLQPTRFSFYSHEKGEHTFEDIQLMANGRPVNDNDEMRLKLPWQIWDIKAHKVDMQRIMKRLWKPAFMMTVVTHTHYHQQKGVPAFVANKVNGLNLFSAFEMPRVSFSANTHIHSQPPVNYWWWWSCRSKSHDPLSGALQHAVRRTRISHDTGSDTVVPHLNTPAAGIS